MSKESIAKAPSGRVRRQPVGTRSRLSVEGMKEDFHYRIFNDVDDRIQTALAAGYEFVPADEVRIGNNRVNQPTAEGSNAQVSVGGGTKGYLMRIPQEWFEEDQKAKAQQVDAREVALKNPALDGTYGKIDISR